jgi:AcrR family transcriptional regulator
MATATRVLAELQRAGLVRAVPGVGTIVEPGSPVTRPARGPRRTAPSPTSGRGGLTVEQIVAAAVAIADAEGLAGLSMRRLAAELGSAPMSIYRHVRDKDQLVLEMIDHVASEWRFPGEEPPDHTRARLEHAARMLWAAFRRHPWLAPALSLTRPQPAPTAMRYSDWVLAALKDSGLDLQTQFTIHLALIGYVRGMALNLETETEAEAASGLDSEQWIDSQAAALQAIIGTGRLPHLEQLIRAGYEFDLDALFEFGLQRILDGVDVLLESRRPS